MTQTVVQNSLLKGSSENMLMDEVLPKDFKNLIKNLLRPLCHELRYLLCTKKKRFSSERIR